VFTENNQPLFLVTPYMKIELGIVTSLQYTQQYNAYLETAVGAQSLQQSDAVDTHIHTFIFVSCSILQ